MAQKDQIQYDERGDYKAGRINGVHSGLQCACSNRTGKQRMQRHVYRIRHDPVLLVWQ